MCDGVWSAVDAEPFEDQAGVVYGGETVTAAELLKA